MKQKTHWLIFPWNRCSKCQAAKKSLYKTKAIWCPSWKVKIQLQFMVFLMLAQPVHIWCNHPYVRTISSTQPVTRQLSRALVVTLLDWSLNLSFPCVNIATEFSDRVAWIGRVVVFSLIILMPSICGLTAKMGLENLTFSSPTDPLYDYSQAKQVLCALVSLHASRI